MPTQSKKDESIMEKQQTLSTLPQSTAATRAPSPAVTILGAENAALWRETLRLRARQRRFSAEDAIALNLLRGLPAERGFTPLMPRKWSGGRPAWGAATQALDHLSWRARSAMNASTEKNPARAQHGLQNAQHLFGEVLGAKLLADPGKLEALCELFKAERVRLASEQDAWEKAKGRGEPLPERALVSERASAAYLALRAERRAAKAAAEAGAAPLAMGARHGF
jgi:hypothetical protein